WCGGRGGRPRRSCGRRGGLGVPGSCKPSTLKTQEPTRPRRSPRIQRAPHTFSTLARIRLYGTRVGTAAHGLWKSSHPWAKLLAVSVSPSVAAGASTPPSPVLRAFDTGAAPSAAGGWSRPSHPALPSLPPFAWVGRNPPPLV